MHLWPQRKSVAELTPLVNMFNEQALCTPSAQSRISFSVFQCYRIVDFHSHRSSGFHEPLGHEMTSL